MGPKTGKKDLVTLVSDMAKDIWAEWDVGAIRQESLASADPLDAIVKAILEKVAVEKEMGADEHGNTILHRAAICEDHGIVTTFLGSPNKEEVIGKLVNARNKRGRTPLHLSARNGFLETVKALLNSGAENVADEYGEIPFHQAARSGKKEVLVATKISDIDRSANEGRTALHFAVIHGNKGAVEWLLKEGATAGKADIDGNTPMHYAELLEHGGEIVKLLVAHGAPLCCKNNDAVMPVTYGRRKTMVQARLSPSARNTMEDDALSLAKDMNGKTILHYAAEGATGVAMDWLLKWAAEQPRPKDTDADITLLQGNDGNTPLHHAAKEGNLPAAKALLEFGSAEALINGKNKAQMTPILCALFENHQKIFEHLCKLPEAFISFESIDAALREEIAPKKGAEANQGDETAQTQVPRFRCVIDYLRKWGKTEPKLPSMFPIYLALHARKFAVFDWLLERGNMNVNMVDKDHHRTCLHWAVLFGRGDVISRLIGTKADLQRVPDPEQDSGLDQDDGKEISEVNSADRNKTQALTKTQETSSDGDISRLLKMKEGRKLAYPHLDLNAKDRYGQTALAYALQRQETRIQQQLLQRMGEDISYKDRQSYVDAANAILVGAALIASITFAGWLQPPLNYTSYYDLPVGSLGAAPGTYESYAAVAQHKGVRVFWACNSLSFFFAMATVLVATAAVLPMPQKSIVDVVNIVRTALIVAAILAVTSVMFVVCAFVAAGFVVLPPIFKYQANMLGTTIVGAFVCLLATSWFLVQLYGSLRPLIGRQKKVVYDKIPSHQESENLVVIERGKSRDGPEDELQKVREPFRTKFRGVDENEYIAKNGTRKRCQVAFP